MRVDAIKLTNTSVLFCILLALSSCVIGPDYAPPEIQAPERFVSHGVFQNIAERSTLDQISQEEVSAANWWKGFSDPALDQFVNEALYQNYSIAINEARLNDAEAQIRGVASRYKLQTGAFVETSADQRNEFGDASRSSTSGGVAGGLSLNLPLDVFGKNKREVEAAVAELESASAALRGAILRVSANVATEYLRLRGNQRQLSLLKGSVELQEKTLSIVESRFNAGIAPELDLRRAEAAVENLRAEIPALQESLINSRNRIAVLTGRFPGKYNEILQEEKDIPSYNLSIEDKLPIEVLSMRPDVKQAEAEFKSAIAQIGVEMTEWYPAFQIGKQLSLGGTSSSGDPLTGTFIAGLRALIQQVVTDGGARQANIDIAKARAEEALAIYHQTLLDAIEEVEQSLAALQSSLAREIPLSKSVEASTRSAFQAEVLYRQGLASFLDVVDAQRVLASAQQRLASTRTAYAVEIATLFRVLGTSVNLEQERSSSASELDQLYKSEIK
ncbi:MAG: efflux transporter outer membrane subunit [Candidatus Hinthialibacter antarcticus]|nr:efflux transporter outer membrane subunit [Candidatus Hinthialibacter antarcticus]